MYENFNFEFILVSYGFETLLYHFQELSLIWNVMWYNNQAKVMTFLLLCECIWVYTKCFLNIVLR